MSKQANIAAILRSVLVRRTEMRFIVPVAILVSAFVASGQAKAQTELRASVDLSEWTPSSDLVLNLETGSYIVTPPTDVRPEPRLRPVGRQGRLVGEELRVTRALAKRAFKEGLVDKECEATKGHGYDMEMSNAVGPMELTLTDGRITQTSVETRCRPDGANTLFSYITRLFDHRSP